MTTTLFCSMRIGACARLALLALAGLALGGCAIGPDRRDPMETFNRKVMDFNEGVDSVVLRPAAVAYKEAVPPLARTGVSNFFGNLSDVWSMANNLAQLKIHNAAENWLRVGVNTFFGLGGVLDIASEIGIERHREDFGQTLGRWGVPTGPYVVLPIFGPSTLRDTLALPIDRRGDPVQQFDTGGWRNSMYTLRAVDVRSNLLRMTSVLSEASLDKYSFTRDAYLQRRRAEVLEGTSRSDDDDDDNAAEGDANTASGSAPAGALPGGSPSTPAPAAR